MKPGRSVERVYYCSIPTKEEMTWNPGLPRESFKLMLRQPKEGNWMGKIRLRHGDDEIEVEGSDAFIRKQVDQFYQRLGGGAPKPTPGDIKRQLLETPAPKPGKKPTPAEFYKSKGKTDGVSQVLIFGKYLEQFENKPEFTMSDLNTVVKEAKLSRNIHSQYFTNAVKQGLLRKQGQKYSLTLSAEEVLASTQA